MRLRELQSPPQSHGALPVQQTPENTRTALCAGLRLRDADRSSNVRHCLIKDELNGPQIVSVQVELISVPLANTVPEHWPPDGRLEL
jgi:hypothetical protein